MKNYIIRVYRQNEEDLNTVVGIVEDIEEEKQYRFDSLSELMKILCGQRKITSEISDEELEHIIRSKFEEKNHSGQHFNLNELRRSCKEPKGDGPGED